MFKDCPLLDTQDNQEEEAGSSVCFPTCRLSRNILLTAMGERMQSYMALDVIQGGNSDVLFTVIFTCHFLMMLKKKKASNVNIVKT